MRVFLDANVLFTAAHNPKGKAALLITLGAEGLFQLATSAYTREEARRNLERKAPGCLPEFGRPLSKIGLWPTIHLSTVQLILPKKIGRFTELPTPAKPMCCSPAITATSDS
jgi:uncharacterized protein